MGTITKAEARRNKGYWVLINNPEDAFHPHIHLVHTLKEAQHDVDYAWSTGKSAGYAKVLVEDTKMEWDRKESKRDLQLAKEEEKKPVKV